MIRIPLPVDDYSMVLAPRWPALGTPGQIAVLTLLGLGPVLLVFWLYRHELRLVRRLTAVALLGLRLATVAILWLLVALQPVVVRATTEELPGRVIVAVDRSASMDIPDPQRTVGDKLHLARALGLPDSEDPETACREVDRLTRTEVARRLLGPDGKRLLQRLQGHHQVELVGFHQEILEGAPERLAELFRAAGDGGKKAAGTDLNLALARALLAPSAGQGPVRGVVLLTDGQHNRGGSPIRKAEELGKQKIPVFAIPLGAPEAPPDIILTEVRGPANVFKGTEASITAHVQVNGLPAQTINVELRQPGADKQVRTIKHEGKDRTYTVTFQVAMDQPGPQTLEINARPADAHTREISTANNRRATLIRVVDSRASVLLIDGEARWEFHYLANALRRDKTVALDTVVFSQPRLGVIPETELAQAGNPRRALPSLNKSGADDPLRKYDCILVGDVSPAQLPLVDRQRLERYVADRGGTLILLAGARHMPLDFVGLRGAAGGSDPLAKMLPIEAQGASTSETGFTISLTTEGAATAYLQMAPEAEANVRRWAELPPHFWAVAGRAKPAAASLAYLAGPAAKGGETAERSRALIATHSYGLGRVLYIGLGSTWRWRYKVGDLYHHRFWGQVVRWAAGDQLLPAGNKYVRFGSRQPVYRSAQEVEVAARLEDAAGPLPPGAEASARIFRQGAGGQEAAVVPLAAVPAQPRLLQGKLSALPPGQYRIELSIPALADKLKATEKSATNLRRDTFTVLPPEDQEMFQLATNWPLLEALAAKSGGRVIRPEETDRLLELLDERVVQHTQREEQRLWQDRPLAWWVLGLFLALLTLEWGGRKLAGLP
jgi:hypothetical protein